jgi:hypothetical protein
MVTPDFAAEPQVRAAARSRLDARQLLRILYLRPRSAAMPSTAVAALLARRSTAKRIADSRSGIHLALNFWTHRNEADTPTLVDGSSSRETQFAQYSQCTDFASLI